jgi:hypothetical protein
MKITVYLFDNYGYYQGQVDVDPQGSIPANSTATAPRPQAGTTPRFAAGIWINVPNAEVNRPEVAAAAVSLQLSRLAFLDRFTDPELVAIYTAAKSEVAIEVMLDKFRAADYIDLSDLRTIAGIEALEEIGLIAEGRAAEILQSR